ncbi:GNAT family N-acetyltransferase [Saliterribacillus persicus]|uniref:Putative GNAT family N-acyltransferase n=1 Tax=Saliterribacillus persicus TaxID=930114 RepID=A0A368XUQ8_9BACI|nr:GNAT family N-acetyltransferase [Saliterribacillus persicus]RCW69764.1 putative GNAT family N-acyltransferase [Saliterribacillus persicus]
MDIKIVEDKKQMDDAYHVRCTVFVEEQKVPQELEIDELEQESIHFIGYEGALPIAASRIRLVEDYGKLERVCVLKTHRGKQYGKQIIQFMEDYARERGYLKSKLNGQTHAEGFYQSLGYHTISEEFMDAGIPHVTMIKDL